MVRGLEHTLLIGGAMAMLLATPGRMGEARGHGATLQAHHTGTLTYGGLPWVPPAGSVVVRDRETGTLWNLRGEAFSGPLAQYRRRLRPVEAQVTHWRAWSRAHATAEIWTPMGTIPQVRAPLPAHCQGARALDGHPGEPAPIDVADALAVSPEHPAAPSDHELVLGVAAYGGEQARARAYPLGWLRQRERVRDRSEYHDVVIGYCPATGGFTTHRSTRDPKWEPLILETTWGMWKRMFPETSLPGTAAVASQLAADTNPAPPAAGSHPGAPAPSTLAPVRSPQPCDPELLPELTCTPWDHRFAPEDLVLGVSSQTDARAYFLTDLAGRGQAALINDQLGTLPLSVLWLTAGRLAFAFDRRVDGITLTLELVTNPEPPPLL